MIYRLIYVSKTLLVPDSEEMKDISEVALARNSACGVTGFLYYDEYVFIQELEGLKSDVEDIYASIRRDKRHLDIRTILTQEASTRIFGAWMMVFHDGGKDGGLLRQNFGESPADTLTNEDGEEVLRFLRELSIGSGDLFHVAQTPRLVDT